MNNANNRDPGLAVEAVQNEVTASSQFNDVFDITMRVSSADAGEDAGVESRNGVTLSQIRI